MDAIERAFLDSVIAAPDDDAPRLIYADWLEEGGNPERAEFIRVQCELGTYGEYRCPKYLGGVSDTLYGLPVVVEGESSCRCRWCGLKSREKALEFRTAFWGADFPFPALPQNGCCVWRRGFVERVRLSADDWLRHADDLVRVAPLREVELTTLPTVVRKSRKLRLSEWPYSHRIWGFVERESGVEIRGSTDARHRVELCLHAAWPGIRFTLPPAITGYPVPPQIATAIEEVMADLEIIDPPR